MHVPYNLSPFEIEPRDEDSSPALQTESSVNEMLIGDDTPATGHWRFRTTFDPDFADDFYGDQNDYNGLCAGANAPTPASLPATLSSTLTGASEPLLHAPVLDMASLTHHSPPPQGKDRSRNSFTCPTPPQNECVRTVRELRESTRTPTPQPRSNSRSCRNFWSVEGDCALLQTMLQNEHLLSIARKSRPRSRYWQTISDALSSHYNMHRNKRQCRDRFNLIYWKAVRDSKQDAPATSELGSLVHECMCRFYIDKDNNLMVRSPEAAPPTIPDPVVPAAPAPPATAAKTSASPSSSSPSISHASQLEAFACLQKQVMHLTQRLEELHQALDGQRALVRQIEHPATDSWTCQDDRGFYERRAGRVSEGNDQIW